MSRRLMLICSIVLLYTGVSAQDTINYPIVDKWTYQFYVQKQWNKVIDIGKIAKKHDIDFYYLQIRMGVAFFEKGKYTKAIVYLEKSFKENPNNEVVQEYLYWSYLYSFRFGDADKIYDSLSDTLRKKIGYERHFIQSFDLNYFHGFNRNFNQLSADSLFPTNNESYLTRDLYKNENIYSLNMYNPGGNGTFFKQTLTISSLNYLRTVNDRLNGPKWYDLKIRQNHYFIQATIPFKRGWSIAPSGGLLWGYIQDERLVRPYMPGAPPTPQIENISFFNFLISGTISKTWSWFTESTNIGISNLDSTSNLQFGQRFDFFPLMNKKIVISGDFQAKPRYNNRPDLVITVQVSSNFKRFSLYGFYTQGPLRNCYELNGAVLYDYPETIASQYGASLQYNLNKIQFRVSAIQQHMDTNYEVINMNGTHTNKTFNFDKLILNGGILWHF